MSDLVCCLLTSGSCASFKNTVSKPQDCGRGGHHPDLGLFPAASLSLGAGVTQQRKGGVCSPGRDPSRSQAGERRLLGPAALSQGLPTTPVSHP